MKTSTKRAFAGIALTGAVILGATGCSSYKDTHGTTDAPIADSNGDHTAANCTSMPDKFSNVCAKCLHGMPGFAVAAITKGQFQIFADDKCTG